MPNRRHIKFVDFNTDSANLIARGNWHQALDGPSLAERVTQIAQRLGQ
jgi:hypothetical protein